MSAAREPLDRETVAKAVERRTPGAVPTCMCPHWGEGLREFYGDGPLNELESRYPDDVVRVNMPAIDWHEVPYSWKTDPPDEPRARDAACLLPDWQHFDEFVERAPTAADLDFTEAAARAREAREQGRYVLAVYWQLFFERPWNFRGMENLMLDYYDHPARVHRLHRYLTETYIAIYRRIAEEVRPDGIQTSDDLGNQRSLNMSPAIFGEFLLPYYHEVVTETHRLGMHFWLHSCGNNTEIMDDLIDAKVDVFHPVQKHTMDFQETADRFGGRISWWAGFDVQHTLQEAAPEDVRAEVRDMIRIFNRPEGGLILAVGNGITPPTPLANIEAFLDEVHGPAARGG